MVEPTQQHRRCVSCGVTETPLWRAGPAGPKTLCNACGVRWRKQKVALENASAGGGGAAAAHRVKVAGGGNGGEQSHQRVRPVVDGAIEKKRPAHMKRTTKDAIHQQQQRFSSTKSPPRMMIPPTRILEKGEDKLDLSKIYFYSEDDDDGTPALIEIEPVEPEVAHFQPLQGRSTLAHERFSVLLDAARVIDLS